MTFRRSPAPGRSRVDAHPSSPTLSPGKRTLTSELDDMIQRQAEAAGPGDDVRAAAARGTSGPAGALPYHAEIQRSFGRHDIGRVKAHVDGRAAEDAAATGARAFAMGSYEAESAGRFQMFGVDGERDKKQFGAESLFPKIGYALSAALPYFNGAKKIAHLTRDRGYGGQPLQRYLKLAWAHGQDVKVQVARQRRAKQPVSPGLLALCEVVTAVEDDLDPFITALEIDGWLGDAFTLEGNDELLPLLARFATAMIDALIELAIDDPSSRMDEERKNKFRGTTTSDEKLGLFSEWRDFKFEQAVKDAAQRGVRYAGMGAGHLYYLEDAGLPSNTHAYDGSGPDLDRFEKA